jgi:hypothetical protein
VKVQSSGLRSFVDLPSTRHANKGVVIEGKLVEIRLKEVSEGNCYRHFGLQVKVTTVC